MRGNNELTINMATMCVAMESYLKTHVLREGVNQGVSKVIYNSNKEQFIIELTDIEDKNEH